MSDPIKTLHDSVMASHAVSNYLSVLLQKFKDAVLHCHERIQKLEANDNCEVCQYAVLTSNKVDDLAERVERLEEFNKHVEARIVERIVGEKRPDARCPFCGGPHSISECVNFKIGKHPNNESNQNVHPADLIPDPTHCTCGGPAWLPRETDENGNAQLCCEKCGKVKAGDEEPTGLFITDNEEALIKKAIFRMMAERWEIEGYGTKFWVILRDLIRDARGQEERG